MKVLQSQHEEIVKMYSVDLVPMIKIAEKYNVSRVCIYKILKAGGVNTKKGSATQIKTECTQCHKDIYKVRCQYRNTLNHFCSRGCLYAWLNRSVTPFITHRHSLRLARKIISAHFNILSWHVVHHEDRNQTNNVLTNLKVFESQGDHVKYHRGFPIAPLWSGFSS